MEKTYWLLQEIKRRPGLYLGTPSVECLRAFISGYKHQELETQGMCQPDCLDGFTEYMQKRYRLCTDHDWASVIRFFSYSEQDAFDAFFKELDRFLQIKVNKE